jgi:hypothetical protein
MDLNKSLQNYYFMIQTDDFKNSIANTKPCPRLKTGSKSQKMILQRPPKQNRFGESLGHLRIFP